MTELGLEPRALGIKPRASYFARSFSHLSCGAKACREAIPSGWQLPGPYQSLGRSGVPKKQACNFLVPSPDTGAGQLRLMASRGREGPGKGVAFGLFGFEMENMFEVTRGHSTFFK